jgi:hypothetical protein
MKIFIDHQDQQIRLTDERKQHILAHPEMAEMENSIEKALLNPEIIRRSNTDSMVYLYYRYHKNTIVGDKWLCVVVKELKGDAFIITAYLTDKLKSGEQTWPTT